MKHQGTKWDDGKTYAALTTWNINFRYDITDDDGRCAVKKVRTDVDIVYHLPRRITTANPVFTPMWDRYMRHLKKHEYGHKDITVKMAGEINEVLASLPSFSSTQALEREAKRRTDEKLQQLKELQLAYDNETRHGETQGAILAAQ
jgi:predicted secreted Zn-dependent protease